MKFKDYFLKEQTWYDKTKSKTHSAVQGTKRFLKDVEKGAADSSGTYGVVKDIAKSAWKNRPNLSNLQKLDNWLKGGSQTSPKDTIAKFREVKVYPNENNTEYNKEVLRILGSGKLNPDGTFTLNPKDSDFGEWVIKRKRPINSASHIANLVIDEYVNNINKQIPKDKAMDNALKSTIKSANLQRFIRRTGMLPI